MILSVTEFTRTAAQILDSVEIMLLPCTLALMIMCHFDANIRPGAWTGDHPIYAQARKLVAHADNLLGMMATWQEKGEWPPDVRPLDRKDIERIKKLVCGAHPVSRSTVALSHVNCASFHCLACIILC